MTTRFDLSELAELADVLGDVEKRARTDLRAVVDQSGTRVRDEMRREASGHPHFPHFPRAITHDVRETATQVTAEVGPDKNLPQGALGNILFFGSANNRAVLDLHGPIDREEPRFVEEVAEAVERLL